MLKTLVFSVGLLIGVSGENETENIICKVNPLEKHGFVQLSENYTEKVCINVLDDTDFIIINADTFNSKEKDILFITLNSHNEVIKMSELYKPNKGF